MNIQKEKGESRFATIDALGVTSGQVPVPGRRDQQFQVAYLELAPIQEGLVYHKVGWWGEGGVAVGVPVLRRG